MIQGKIPIDRSVLLLAATGLNRRLTGKQRSFVDNYVVTLNASEAVRCSGYNTHHPDKLGSQLLGNP